MERGRWVCTDCPAFFESDSREPLKPTAGGWETKIIDGREVTCCRPAATLFAEGRIRYCDLYCLVGNGRKIGHLATWTGLQPAWCPRLTAEKEG